MISSAQLTAIQNAVTATFDKSCQVQRNTPTSSAWGTQTDSWATVATVNVSLAKPSAAIVSQYAEKLGSLASWLVRFPAGQDVRVQDQLIVASQTLKVQVLLSPRSYPFSLLVLAAEVE